MALLALDTIRNAEISAQRIIVTTQEEAERRIADAQSQAEKILADAKDKVSLNIESSAERARKKSEEIIVTSRNEALLKAKKLRDDCVLKQNLVNEKVIKLIV